jgi:hypothetical protein
MRGGGYWILDSGCWIYPVGDGRFADLKRVDPIIKYGVGEFFR